MGLDEQGMIKAIGVDMLIDGGAHGEHSFDVLCVGCNNSIPIYRAGEALSSTERLSIPIRSLQGHSEGSEVPRSLLRLRES